MATKGKEIDFGGKVFSSRSELAQSAICRLLLRGYTSEEIIKYLVMDDKEGEWYERSINEAINYLSNYGDRPEIAELYNSPIAISGRTGSTDYAVYKACLALAWLIATAFELRLSLREISLYSALSINTISKSYLRLESNGFIHKVDDDPSYIHNLYSVKPERMIITDTNEIASVSYVSNKDSSRIVEKKRFRKELSSNIFCSK